MSTIDEISDDRDAAFRVIDALLIEARRRELQGNPSMGAVRTSLRNSRNQIEDAALTAILASSELAAALKILAKVAKDLGDTATNEQIAAQVVSKFADVLGKAKTVAAEAQKVLGGGS